MSKNLVIVESPAKATTIEKYLGKDFTVKSSFGHIRDLAKKGLSIDIENDFAPEYDIDPDKKKLVSELKKLAKSSEVVWLATDEDREGEAISWHLKEALKLDDAKTKRITFNEITKPAILKAIEKPREINLPLVDAQQARRVLDRLVGFELSPVLWKKVRPSLSAGRVQSVAVRLVVEREKEINAFESKPYYRVVAIIENDSKQVEAVLKSNLENHEQAVDLLKRIGKQAFEVTNVEVKPSKRNPAPPFTTSTLQQEASRKHGFSVSQTMRIAQGLYEAGHITYMRTDSVNLSQTAIDGATKEISTSYGENYVQVRQYANKSKGAQEAHEAIRPTNFELAEAPGDEQAKKLYKLIRNRTLASQMASAELEKTNVVLIPEGQKEEFVAKGEVIKFDGFLKVYIEGTDDEDTEEAGLLPPFAVGEKYGYREVKATQRFSHHPARFTEASLVKKLEELGIGRPSTYAPTISTIQKRGYVNKDEKEGAERKYEVLNLIDGELKEETKTEITGREKNKFSPTDIGVVVNDFLVQNFEGILSYHFTAEVESKFDEIAEGKLSWQKMIEEFYNPFHHKIEDTLENSERASGERHLGEDPKTGKPIIARIGRFGPMVQIGSSEDEDKPQFASLRKNQSISSITLEEALDLFKLPRSLGEFDGDTVKANVGRFGPYIQLGKKFYSLKASGLDPMQVSLEEAIEVIKEGREKEAKSLIKEFSEDATIKIKDGRYGPYISKGRSNFKIPKDTEPKSLTYEQVLEIIENAPKKKTRAKSKKK